MLCNPSGRTHSRRRAQGQDRTAQSIRRSHGRARNISGRGGKHMQPGWKMSPAKSNEWMEQNMFPPIPLGDPQKTPRPIRAKNTQHERRNHHIGLRRTRSTLDGKDTRIRRAYEQSGSDMDAGLRSRAARRHSQRHRNPQRHPISSPVLDTYDTAVVLNQQSLDKFESKVKARRTPHIRCLRHTPPPRAHRHNRTRDTGDGCCRRDGQLQDIQHDCPGAILGMKPVVDVDAVLRGLKKDPPRAPPPPAPTQRAGYPTRHGPRQKLRNRLNFILLCF